MSIVGSFLRRVAGGISAQAPQVARDERVYAVGDIHGRADLLAAMLERIRADVARFDDHRAPRIVFLGDYVDRGDQSRETLDMLVALRSGFAGASVTFLRGNHEAALLSFLADPAANADWFSFGGLQTLASYGAPPPRSADPSPMEMEDVRDALEAALGDHLAFLEGTELFAWSGDVVFCHAGLDPDSPLERQSEQALLWGRSEFLAKGGIEGIRVVHGHYAAPDPVVTPLRVCVDTGAFYTGRLTAVRLDRRTETIAVAAFGSFET